MANETSGFNTNNLPIVTDGQVAGTMAWPVDTFATGGAAPQGAAMTALQAAAGPFTIVAAAGASQGNATPILAFSQVLVTVTASTEGVILPTAATGRRRHIFVPGTVGVKVYPPLGGTIDSGSANASVTLAAGKGSVFVAKDATHWYTALKGA